MVMNTPGGNTVSTAQLTLSLLSSLARNIPAADFSVKQVMINYLLFFFAILILI
jgi:phosphoglycerate dehydrogenase-like enzyme